MEQAENISTKCLSCGEQIAGSYCASCGEKVLKENEKTVSHFLGQALHNITHADGKFFKSLKCILLSPGTLSLNYLNGKRKQYMNPLSMFVFANLLYLLFTPIDALNSGYYSQPAQPYGTVAVRKFEEKMKTKGWTEVQMSERYNAKSAKLAKLFLILLVLYFSVPLALIYFSRKRYYIDHLVFSTEVINFLILVAFLILPWLLNSVLWIAYKLFGTKAGFDANDTLLLLLLLLGLVAYLSIASQRVYQTGLFPAIIKSVILVVGLAFCTILYRFTLFQATMALL